jgi:hypothetical protein
MLAAPGGSASSSGWWVPGVGAQAGDTAAGLRIPVPEEVVSRGAEEQVAYVVVLRRPALGQAATQPRCSRPRSWSWVWPAASCPRTAPPSASARTLRVGDDSASSLRAHLTWMPRAAAAHCCGAQAGAVQRSRPLMPAAAASRWCDGRTAAQLRSRPARTLTQRRDGHAPRG